MPVPQAFKKASLAAKFAPALSGCLRGARLSRKARSSSPNTPPQKGRAGQTFFHSVGAHQIGADAVDHWLFPLVCPAGAVSRFLLYGTAGRGASGQSRWASPSRMENRRSMRSETSSAKALTAPTHTTGVSRIRTPLPSKTV